MNNQGEQNDFAGNPVLERYEAVIGLEVHCQLLCKSKLFCSCSAKIGNAPNNNTCPVCLGLPGSLPVLNETAVDFAIAMGLAINGDIKSRSVFSRKQYFYPDLPKGYQISQYDLPYCEGGKVILDDGFEVSLTRIHIEEDAGKNVHGDNASYVDLNRAGTPLIEIVTEPVLRTPSQAVEYLRKLHSITRYLKISDGNMDEGSFRCDANVSIRKHGESKLGVRTEVKNLNSFRNIERAITYEIFRQADILDSGSYVKQETMLFDAASGKTSPIRSKEDSPDYRYFPDPDLGPLVIEDERINRIREGLPELPQDRAKRFQTQYKLSSYDSRQLTSEREISDLFERVIELQKTESNPKLAANWILTEVLRVLDVRNHQFKEIPISAEQLAELLDLMGNGTISGKIAKSVFDKLLNNGGMPSKIVSEEGLTQISDRDEIKKAILELIDNSPNQVNEYVSGKNKVFGYFVGQIMKTFKGKCNPGVVNELLREILDARRQ